MPSLKDKINKDNLPKHIAIIMDGNGRWARRRGNLRIFGHRNSIKAVRETIEGAAELGVRYLTLFAFSTENWGRPKEEVSDLMGLLFSTLGTELKNLNKNNIKLSVIGDINKLPPNISQKLNNTIKATSGNSGLNLVLALSYSSHWEILNATKEIAKKVKNNLLDVDDISKEVFEQYLTTGGMPHPDILIRTSGEHRISNFLLWQLAYSELYFTDVLWPDFHKEELYKAIISYQQRERRFGLTSEQIKSVKE